MWCWGLAAALFLGSAASPSFCLYSSRRACGRGLSCRHRQQKSTVPPHPCCPGSWPTAPLGDSVKPCISISIRAVSASEPREPPTSCDVGPYKQATPPFEVNRPGASHHSNGCLVVCLGGSAASHVEGAAYSGYASLLLACGHCQYLSLSPLNAHPTGTRIRHDMCCILLL